MIRFVIAIHFLALIISGIASAENSPQKISCLYRSLDPKSVAEHLAFYELYPHTPEGQRALKDSWSLLCSQNESQLAVTPLQISQEAIIPFSVNGINAIIALVNKQANEVPPELADADLAIIDTLAKNLSNRKLAGFHATTESEILKLPPNQIDLARALFIAQFGDDDEALRKLHSYEAAIDLMALQISARFSAQATPREKIALINQFIFFELGYRFPPHSLYAKEIDLYTFLPSVLDSRRGVCLGVSILYLTIAQRLGLDLEIITPPGHIYIRYRDSLGITNIETTARGIHVDCDEYLSADTRKLQQRDIKEVVGMAYFNQAAALISQDKFSEALDCYKHAAKYQPNDPQVQEFLAYAHLLCGDEESCKKLLKNVAYHLPDEAVSNNTLAIECLEGKADRDALAALLQHVDEDRKSVLEKQQKLQKAIERCPHFSSGYFALAATWMQLHRQGEALAVLERFHHLNPNDPTAEYYLAALYKERFDLPKAWEHLANAEALVAKRQYAPRALKELRREMELSGKY